MPLTLFITLSTLSTAKLFVWLPSLLNFFRAFSAMSLCCSVTSKASSFTGQSLHSSKSGGTVKTDNLLILQ